MPDNFEVALSHKPSALQTAFINGVADGLGLSESIIKAGYNFDQPGPAAAHMLQQPHIMAALQIQIAKRLAIGAAVSRALLQRCVEDERVDMRLRVACAKDLLNRAGFIAPKAAEASRGVDKPLNDMSTTELRALADKLEGELADRAKPVSSASAAPVAAQAIDDII